MERNIKSWIQFLVLFLDVKIQQQQHLTSVFTPSLSILTCKSVCVCVHKNLNSCNNNYVSAFCSCLILTIWSYCSCMQWIENCGTQQFFEDFAYSGTRDFLDKKLCSDHFMATDFIDEQDMFSG